MLHTRDELREACGGLVQDAAAPGVTAISIDSRELPPGALFVAIKGERFDGHDFVRQAVDAGAALAMVSAERAADLAGLPLIVVPDALAGLVDLARHARARSAGRVVAVTGSAGKTTTKELIRAVLAAAGPTHASIKSFNNHWGVPLMLARMPRDSAFGVFELGMNHAGEIAPLSDLVRPHVAVITTVAAAHLEAFDSVEGIARAKAEIFSGLEAGGLSVLNADHAYLDVLVKEAGRQGVARILTYGYGERADVRISDYRPEGEGAKATVSGLGAPVRLRLPVPGRHICANAVAALCVAREFGLDIAAAARSLAAVAALSGRGAVEVLGERDRTITLIDESYNANPASMRAALETFAGRAAGGGRKVLVLGDMRELGPESRQLHAELKRSVEECGADQIYLVGENMRALAEALGDGRVAALADDVDLVTPSVLNGLAFGDTVMIKGSNGVRLGSLVSRIRSQFGDGAPTR